MSSGIVGIVNQKGGVGKTTLTVHLAVALARRGSRVIVVDGDAQGNATSWLLDGDLEQAGMFDLLVVSKTLAQCIRPVSRWNLAVLPGNARTAEALIFLAATNKPFETISQALSPLASMSDVVLLDMPPSRAAGFQEMLYACNWVIVPTQLERLPVEGVSLMANTVQEMTAAKGKGPRLLGIVPNMVRFVNEHREQLEELVEMFGPVVWPPVPLSVRVSEACAYGDVVFDRDPKGSVAMALMEVVARFVSSTCISQREPGVEWGV
jgi:chromosome partitioning protein